MKAGKMVTFKVVNRALNDFGTVYTMRVVEEYVNGLKLEKNGITCIAMYGDIELI